MHGTDQVWEFVLLLFYRWDAGWVCVTVCLPVMEANTDDAKQECAHNPRCCGSVQDRGPMVKSQSG